MSFEILTVNTHHKSILQDVCFNISGQRMATCSDGQIKVWNQSESGNWNISCEWTAHNYSLVKIAWAPSELGEILATCASDGSTSIWEEIATDKPYSNDPKMWIRRAEYVYPLAIISDLKFAPYEFGLILTTCSTDGFVRFYNAPNVFDTSEWKFQYEINFEQVCKSVAWSDSNDGSNWPLVAIGCDEHECEYESGTDTNSSDELTSVIFLYEYQEEYKTYVKADDVFTYGPVHDMAFAPALGRTDRLLAVAANPITIFRISDSLESGTRYDIIQKFTDDDFPIEAYKVDWDMFAFSFLASCDGGAIRTYEEYEDDWKLASLDIDSYGITQATVKEQLSDGCDVITIPANIVSRSKPKYIEFGCEILD